MSGGDSLREARALLMRKTLAKGGRGDKMAAALMKHIEKERKKLWSVTSSTPPLQSSVRSQHPRLPSPAGGSTPSLAKQPLADRDRDQDRELDVSSTCLCGCAAAAVSTAAEQKSSRSRCDQCDGRIPPDRQMSRNVLHLIQMWSDQNRASRTLTFCSFSPNLCC